jgi:hypothetical protein
VGYWSLSAGTAPGLAPHFTVGQISYPIPLPIALERLQVHYINPTKRKELEAGVEEIEIEPGVIEKQAVSEPGCYSPALEEKDPKLLEEPKAEPDNLCVYAGIENLLPDGSAGFSAIENAKGISGSTPYGAAVVFEVFTAEHIAEKTNKIRAQETWAVAE